MLTLPIAVTRTGVYCRFRYVAAERAAVFIWGVLVLAILRMHARSVSSIWRKF